jgi:hypothetical protein
VYKTYFYTYKNNGCISKSLTILGVDVWSCYYKHGFGWFRFFGKGIKWKNVSIYNYTFSERYGFSKGLNIGKWYVSIL